jgi:hypothetical protein
MILEHEQHYFRIKYDEHIDIGAKNLLQTLTFMVWFFCFGNQTPYVEVLALSYKTLCSVSYLKLTYM